MGTIAWIIRWPLSSPTASIKITTTRKAPLRFRPSRGTGGGWEHPVCHWRLVRASSRLRQGGSLCPLSIVYFKGAPKLAQKLLELLDPDFWKDLKESWSCLWVREVGGANRGPPVPAGARLRARERVRVA